MQLDNTDKKLLDIIQNQFPLSVRPYKDIALMLDMSEESVIERLKNLMDNGIIRRMGAIFDSNRIGYTSTLCAMEVPHQRIEEVTQIVNEYNGITHNYLRDDTYNMWFTITARSGSEIDKIISEIKSKSSIDKLINLPSINTFKIEVRFSMSDAQEVAMSSLTRQKGSPAVITKRDQKVIREIQGNIPLCHNPFKAMAGNLGISEAELLSQIKEMKKQGIIRRFSAVLRHKNVGIETNVMGVWFAPLEKIEESGKFMASFPQISHCYQRDTTPDWHYNIYTMIHGKSTDDCKQLVKNISLKTGITDYRLLYSIRELKKSTMNYFTEKGSEL
jgi:DNA-binding Lrp family transcriptional regulator